MRGCNSVVTLTGYPFELSLTLRGIENSFWEPASMGSSLMQATLAPDFLIIIIFFK